MAMDERRAVRTSGDVEIPLSERRFAFTRSGGTREADEADVGG
jgi:hypothetical protein